MSLGTLNCEVHLDNPKKIHYGNSDPVTGNVSIKFFPKQHKDRETPTELFGPLKVGITLHGRCKSKIWKRNGNSTTIYRGRVPLFSWSKWIYNDSIKTPAGKVTNIPFSINFPETDSNRIGGDWEQDSRYLVPVPGQPNPLPPSFVDDYSGVANHFESFIEYRVTSSVAMAHVDIKIQYPDMHKEPLVHYQVPKLLRPIEAKPMVHNNTVSVKNEFLLPEADRPTGFRQKAKAAFSSDYYPTYGFSWKCLAPKILNLGQPAAFQLSIKPYDSNTAVLVPDVTLSFFTVEIKAYTTVRAEKQLFSTPEAESDGTVATLQGVADSKDPFSKANDWTKTINTKPLVGIPICFKTYNICRRYQMKIKMAFWVAGKNKPFTQVHHIEVHPPLEDGGHVEAGSSSVAAASSSAGERLIMGEVIATLPEAALPQYERPPEYEEAPDDSPVDGVGNGKAPAGKVEEMGVVS